MLAVVFFWFQVDSDNTFQKGNEAYASSRYEEARAIYESLLTEGMESAELHYNLGNTFFKLKRIGPAILHYEKSLRLQPFDEDAVENLKLAELRKKDRMVIPPDFFLFSLIKRARDMLSLHSWNLIAVTLWWLLAVNLVLRMIGKPAMPRWLRFIVLIFFIAALTGCIGRWWSDNHRQEAIVLAPAVDARNEPSIDSSVLFVLHEGSKVLIRNEYDNWIEAVLPDGKAGWIRASDVSRI